MCERGEDRWAQAVSVVAWAQSPQSASPPLLSSQLSLNTLVHPGSPSDPFVLAVTQPRSSISLNQMPLTEAEILFSTTQVHPRTSPVVVVTQTQSHMTCDIRRSEGVK